MTVGVWDSSTACLSWKAGEELKSHWVASSPAGRPRILAQTSLTSSKSFSYSLNLAAWRAASVGPVEAVVSASSASFSFLTLEGVARSLDLPAMALLLRFRKLWAGSLTLRTSEGGSFSVVSSSVLSELVSEASMVCSWNEDWFLKCLVQTSLVLTSHC